MSVKVMGMVWDCVLPRDEKYVLLAYADHAGHDGEGIWPAVATMARKTGYSDRSIQTITKKLIKRTVLLSSGKGKYGTNKYDIDMSILRGLIPPEESAPRKKQREAPEESAPKPSSEPSINNNDVGFGEVITKWESLRGTINAHISERLGDIYDELIEHIEDLPGTHPDCTKSPGEYLVKAIGHMGDYADTPNINYLEKVVDGWKRHGVGSKPPGKRGNNRKPARQSTEDRVNELMGQVSDGE